MDLDAPALKLVGDDLRRPHFLEGGFRMAMDVASDGGELSLGAGEEIGCETGHAAE